MAQLGIGSISLGYQQLTNLSSAQALVLPPTSPVGSVRGAIVQVSGQAVRWRDDGTAPTATVGMTIPVGGELRFDGDLSKVKFIEAAAGAVMDVTIYA